MSLSREVLVSARSGWRGRAGMDIKDLGCRQTGVSLDEWNMSVGLIWATNLAFVRVLGKSINGGSEAEKAFA
jgi:hypothetical protein